MLGEFISEKCIQIQFAHKQNRSLNLQMQIDKLDNNLYNLNHVLFIGPRVLLPIWLIRKLSIIDTV